ncbi:unnamed protein product [Linum trigynum]|uniref:Uncharacterized protein n=1 Tax=Linum trigynum TaxID=586398 RepID=A0AAV2D068_9ROSI
MEGKWATKWKEEIEKQRRKEQEESPGIKKGDWKLRSRRGYSGEEGSSKNRQRSAKKGKGEDTPRDR